MTRRTWLRAGGRKLEGNQRAAAAADEVDALQAQLFDEVDDREGESGNGQARSWGRPSRRCPAGQARRSNGPCQGVRGAAAEVGAAAFFRVQEHDRQRLVEAAARRVGSREVQLSVAAIDVHAPQPRKRFRRLFLLRRHVCPVQCTAAIMVHEGARHAQVPAHIPGRGEPPRLPSARWRPTVRTTRRFMTGSCRLPATGPDIWKIRCRARR